MTPDEQKVRLFALEKAISRIRSTSSRVERGTQGCTYGDTNYDSPSAAYGHNVAMEYIADLLPPECEHRNESVFIGIVHWEDMEDETSEERVCCDCGLTFYKDI